MVVWRVLERPRKAAEEFDGTLDELWAEIDRLTKRNRSRPNPATERQLLQLRHLAGIKLLDAPEANPQFAEPETDALPGGDPLPEFSGAGSITPGLLRAAILRDGCALVRGLFPRDKSLHLAEQIDRAFSWRERRADKGKAGYYEEFLPHERFGPIGGRHWIMHGGGLLAIDSPALHFEMSEMFAAAGLPALVSGYLGEPALTSLHKTTLRKATPDVAGAWHQDGKFMGSVRSINLWVSLSRCGDESPGLDIVPKRLDHLAVTQTDEAMLDYVVSERVAAETAQQLGVPIIRPIFEPGDALFFDELFLHKTGSDPSMPKPRYAIEHWFFGGAAFPSDYAPAAV